QKKRAGMRDEQEIGPDGYLARPEDPLCEQQMLLNQYMAQCLPDAPFKVDPRDYVIGLNVLKGSRGEAVRMVEAICHRLLWLRTHWVKRMQGENDAAPVEVEVGHFGEVLKTLLKGLL